MPMYGKRSARSRELPGSIGHCVVAVDRQARGNVTAYGPFSTSMAAIAFALHANEAPDDGYRYTALILIPPGRHRVGGQ